MKTRNLSEADYLAVADRDEDHFFYRKALAISGKKCQKIAVAFANADGGEFVIGIADARTHLINILCGDICETEVAQGVSADRHGWPLGIDRRTVGVGGTSLAPGAA